MEYMSVGELAKRANVTVRTLQYYDKIGILKPSHISEGKRRLYTENDMTILHQIITFKNLGLSLEEIKSRLIPIHSNDDIKMILLKQAELIKEQIIKATNIVESIEMIAEEINDTHSVDWSKYSNMMQLIQENNESFWVINYLDNEVLESIANVHEQYTEDELPSDWLVKYLKKAKILIDAGLSPESTQAQSLASDIWVMVETYAQGQPQMIQKLFDFFKDTTNWPSKYAQIQHETQEFITEAIDYHIRRM